MQTTIASPLDNFFSYFLKSKESGLLISENRLQLAKVHALLAHTGIHIAKSWRGTLRQLALDIPVAALITAPIEQEFFDIVQQYQQRSGLIQILDRSTLDITTVHCNPFYARLLLVVEKEDLAQIEATYPIRRYTGMIEII